MVQELKRGQRAPLPADLVSAPLTLRVVLDVDGPQDYPSFCLLTDATETLLGGDQLVLADGGQSRDGALRAIAVAPAEFVVELSKLAPECHRVVLAFGVTRAGRARGADASTLRRASVHLLSAGEERHRFELPGSELDKETAVVLLELYRKDGWRVHAAGVGFVGGVDALVARYHGDPEALRRRLGSAPALPAAPPDAAAPMQGGGVVAAAGWRGKVTLPRAWPSRNDPAVPAGLLPAMGLVAVDRGDRAATGTGFMVGPGGVFLTCAHVVSDMVNVSIALEGTNTWRKASVIAVDEPGDLALLHVDDRDGAADWLLLAPPDSTPALGDALGLLGYPLGGDLGHSLTYSQGVVNSLRRQNDVSVLQVDTGAAPGSSGGPVFRRADGRVVGVMTSGLANKPGGMLVNFATDIRRIWQLGWVG